MTSEEIARLLKTLSTQTDEATLAKVIDLAVDARAYDKSKAPVDSGKKKVRVFGKRTRIEKQEGKKQKIKGTFSIPKKEINNMSKEYRSLFACEDRIVHYRFHKGVFEASYRKNGLNIFACAKTFAEMKEKFMEKLYSALNHTTRGKCFVLSRSEKVNQKRKLNVKFSEYINEWLSIKKATVKKSTYAEYERLAEYHLLPTFGNKFVEDIPRQTLQKYLFEIVGEGKCRTAQKLHLVLTCIFDLIEEDLEIKNPMKKIVLPYYESKKGSALTKSEEKKLVDYCINNKDNAACSAFLILLYFGLRRSELKTITIENEMLTCITSKQKLGRNEATRTIPFTPMFKRVLSYVDFEKVRTTNLNTIQSTFKRLLPNHHVHELRYTFITRAKEAGCNQEVVMIWAGHSFDKDVKTSVVDRGYTDYSREYIIKEAQKIDYPL